MDSKKELIFSRINRYCYQWTKVFFRIKQRKNPLKNKFRCIASSNSSSINNNKTNYSVRMTRINLDLKFWGCLFRNSKHRTLKFKSRAVYQYFKIQGETCLILFKKLITTKTNFNINDGQQPLIWQMDNSSRYFYLKIMKR